MVLSATLISQITENTGSRGEQVLLFLNRRGYAPALNCNECHHGSLNVNGAISPYTFHQHRLGHLSVIIAATKNEYQNSVENVAALELRNGRTRYRATRATNSYSGLPNKVY